MSAHTESSRPKLGSRRAENAFFAAAVLVFIAGIALSFAPSLAASAFVLRWIGLVLFLPVAWRRRSLLVWTFYAMIAGVVLGLDAPHFSGQLRVIGDVFLRLIRMIVAPLIFGGIVTGIAGHSELKGVGRVALKAVLFFEVVTTLGLVLGLIAINLSHAGVGVTLPATSQAVAPAAHSETWQQLILNIFPENIAQAVAQNQILQVAIFSLLFGTALATLPESKRAPLVTVLQSLTDTMFRMTKIIMVIAPLAAGAAMAYTVSSAGLHLLASLALLAVTYYGAIAAFILLVLIPILVAGRISVRRFAAAIAEPAAIGFATTSSEAALPLAMERLEEFGVPRWIVSFVVPTGYSFNMTGSSVYLTMAAIFAAQAAGIHLSLGEQLIMLATLMLTSKGVAGVPRATLVVLMASAADLHIPSSAILVLLGVDTLMDMGRSAMNVIGNCMAAVVVARWEGELQDQSA
ncbi:dicarboxylate/amino acid:cation symporter [Occallatibacter riparius]|uniref:Cation:dicarboxylase symporter family transporter n=1 Tax=Occallatibacter riparius TaxID=1002689 RepID=A0A9J7BQY3_9BACT|nr:cation:dicarboxylase symporter family transporter [Occallatibacter riparius]UWZ84991.1 cation:dicarboxylase symporter family transporter [Occallatibacter riparius]